MKLMKCFLVVSRIKFTTSSSFSQPRFRVESFSVVVHVLGAVEHQHVNLCAGLHRHQRGVHRVSHVAEDKADVPTRHARGRRQRRLQRIGHPYDVLPLPPARHGQHAHEQADFPAAVAASRRRRRRRPSPRRRLARRISSHRRRCPRCG